MKNLKFATGNQNKLKEAREILGFDIEQLDVDIDEIQEVDVKKVIEHKAKTAFDYVGEPVLVEDTSLEIESLGGFPGALIKWLLKSVGVAGICKIVSAFSNNNARASTCVGMYDGNKVIIGEGIIHGAISDLPKGENNFGWDPIFIPDGHQKTFAEIGSEEKNKISMRRLAFEDFKRKISEL